MNLPTTVRYGARAMTELAVAYPHRPVSVREAAENQRISPKYLEQILKPLRAAGLVEVVRGRRGGYVLARPPHSITLKDLFESLAGSVVPLPCIDHPNSCSMQDICPTQETWVEIKQAVEGVLERTTIQCLVGRRRQKTASSAAIHEV